MADPHNANRGFFFAHMGWLMVRKHPAVMKAGKTINMADLEQDPYLMFQHRHYIKCFLMAGFVLPTLIPMLWGEDPTTAYFMAVVRYTRISTSSPGMSLFSTSPGWSTLLLTSSG